MNLIGNILWFILGGLESGLGWILAGLICCITIIGIPLGIQCFKLASMSFFPFGKEIRYTGDSLSFLANLLWLIFLGLPLAIGNAIIGLLWCCTIIGIPFGLQFFKIAELALAPFGKEIV